MDISVVVPLYNSGIRIAILHQSLVNILSFYRDYEIIFVDDGSKDNTPEIIEKIKERDPHVRIIQLSRNYGQHAALFAGYKCSTGAIVISLDDDAFEESKYIPAFIKKIEEGCDGVFGWREKIGYPLSRRIASFLFNVLVSLISGKRIHDGGSSIKARNRRLVDKIVSFGDPVYLLKYGRYHRIAEIKIPLQYSKRFSTRYNSLKLLRSLFRILRNSVFPGRREINVLAKEALYIN